MTKKKNGLPLLASVVTAVGFVSASKVVADVPRGPDIGELAGNCRIGTFPQTSKAGSYNSLCEIMEDSEKCLAFIKGQFSFDGISVKVTKVHQRQVDKAKYCLNVLKRDLGLDVE